MSQEKKAIVLPEKSHLHKKRFYLRGKAFSLEEQLDKVGSRREKFWFVVRSSSTREELLMCITFADVKIDRNIFADVLLGVRSHFICEPVAAEYVEEKKMAVVFRRIVKGSLRDIICNSKWSQPYARKYGRKGGEPLSEARIATWGRHVLEGINFLRLKGYYYFFFFSFSFKSFALRFSCWPHSLRKSCSRKQRLQNNRLREQASSVPASCAHVSYSARGLRWAGS